MLVPISWSSHFCLAEHGPRTHIFTVQKEDADGFAPRLDGLRNLLSALNVQRREAAKEVRQSQTKLDEAQQSRARIQQDSQQASQRTAELRIELENTHAVRFASLLNMPFYTPSWLSLILEPHGNSEVIRQLFQVW